MSSVTPRHNNSTIIGYFIELKVTHRLTNSTFINIDLYTIAKVIIVNLYIYKIFASIDLHFGVAFSMLFHGSRVHGSVQPTSFTICL